MNISQYNIMYIITSIFGTYIIFYFMGIFFNRENANKKREFFSYALYFIFGTGIYFFINIPIVNMGYNIIAFFALSFNYRSDLKKRLLSVILIYMILMCIEILVVSISYISYIPIFTSNQYNLSYGLIANKILSYFVVLGLRNYKNIKSNIPVPLSYWIMILFIPLSSLYLILIIIQIPNIAFIYIITSVSLLFFINFSVFYLYDKIIVSLSEKMDQLLLAQQNKYYENQFHLMKNSLKKINTLKHDWTNHLSVIHLLAQKGEKEKSIHHIEKIIEIFREDKEYAKSGNIIIDSILNFKLQEVQEKDIDVSIQLNVPKEMEIPSFDIAILLGNLLDNAIEAVCAVKGDRYIHIKIKYDRGRFILQIENPFQGEIRKEEGQILTTKEDKGNHGLGIQSIKETLKKYNGSIKIETKENVFSAILLLYIEN